MGVTDSVMTILGLLRGVPSSEVKPDATMVEARRVGRNAGRMIRFLAARRDAMDAAYGEAGERLRR